MGKIKHGGYRLGAGRKVGTGKYGESTKVIRVPISKVTDIKHYILRQQSQNIDTMFNVKISNFFFETNK